MRFAYIDSNGNEVPIPSVDALALRIELGAINESTELYDAQADQWGPAHTHEIFHTLSRAAEGGGQGFVAPLPPLPAAASPEAEKTAEPAAPPPPSEPEPEEEDDDALGLTLAAAKPPPEDADDDDGGLPGLDAEEGGFDFGDLGGGLELDGGFDPGGAAEPAMDFGGGGGSQGLAGLEQEMEFSAADAPMELSSGGLDLEQPMSEFTPEAPPAWMEPEETSASGDVMDFSSVGGETAEAPAVPGGPRPKRTPKDRPSRPKFKRQRNLVAPIVTVVVLAAIGVGGYVAWPIVRAELASRNTSDEGVVLPPLREDLVPRMRSVAGLALARAYRSARGSVESGPPSPGESWLAGVYFANATQYPQAEAFWTGIGAELDAIRGIDLDAFHAALERSLEDEGLAGEDRAALAERADSGFVAGARGRAQTYDLVDELVAAALDLHDFLVANEANIEYTPAATITSDPVLEARPATPEIGDAMEVRLERVTEALDGLNYLELVTADGLWAAVLNRVQEVGFR